MNYDLSGLILVADEAVIVVNKPAGLRTLPDGYHLELPYLRGILEPEYGRLWITHRLDRETSGVIVLARTAESHRCLNNQFEKRQIIKKYHSLVKGNPDWNDKEIKLPLRVNGDRRHRSVVDQRNGKPAWTRIQLIEKLGGYCLVEAEPRTGRTHQIRAHLAAIGMPVLEDLLYGTSESVKQEKSLINRPALHALSISFLHPTTQAKVFVQAPYPEDFWFALSQLRLNSQPNG